MRRTSLTRSSAGVSTYLIEKHGWTQARLAEVLGVHRSFISRVVAGQRELSPDHFDVLAAAAGIPTGALMLAASPPAEDAPPHLRKLVGLCHELIKSCDATIAAIEREHGRPTAATSRRKTA